MESTRTVRVEIVIDYRQPGWPADHWQKWDSVTVTNTPYPERPAESLKDEIEQKIDELASDDIGWGPDVAHRLRRVKTITLTEPYEL